MIELWELAKSVLMVIGGLVCASAAFLFWCLARAAAKEAPEPLTKETVKRTLAREEVLVQQVYRGHWSDAEWLAKLDAEMEEFVTWGKL